MNVQLCRQCRVASLLVMATAILVAFATSPARAGTLPADVAVTKLGTPNPVAPGANISYTVTVTNNGPGSTVATLSDVVPTGTTFVSVTSPPGPPCSTPAVGGTGTVTCSIPFGTTGTRMFTVVVNVNPGVCPQAQISNTATVSGSVPDPNPPNNTSPAVITNVNCGYTLAVQPAAPSDAAVGTAVGAAAGPIRPTSGDPWAWRPYAVLVAAAGFTALGAALARRQRRGPTR